MRRKVGLQIERQIKKNTDDEKHGYQNKKVWNRELEGQIIYQRNISQKL